MWSDRKVIGSDTIFFAADRLEEPFLREKMPGNPGRKEPPSETSFIRASVFNVLDPPTHASYTPFFRFPRSLQLSPLGKGVLSC